MLLLVLWLLVGVSLVIYRLYGDWRMLREMHWRPGLDVITMSYLEAAVFWPVDAAMYVLVESYKAIKETNDERK